MSNPIVGLESPLRVALDQPVPPQAIRALAAIIADKFDPERIILFGSYGYGQPEPWSDVDILVVMDTPNGPWPVTEAIRLALPPHSFGLDLLVRSQAEIERRIAIGDWFMEEITTRGKVLYERGDGRVGSEGGK